MGNSSEILLLQMWEAPCRPQGKEEKCKLNEGFILLRQEIVGVAFMLDILPFILEKLNQK